MFRLLPFWKYSNKPFCLFFFLCHLLIAQDTTKSPIIYGGNLYGGFIFKHAISVAHLAKYHPYGAEISIAKQTIGNKIWHKPLGFPNYGYSLTYFNFNAGKILGKAFANMIFLEVPFRRRTYSSFAFRFGTGWTIHTHPFDIEHNPTNNFFSSRVTNIIYLNLNYSYLINEKWALKAGLNWSHYSNGALTVPNQGINIPHLNIGFSYSPQKLRPTRVTCLDSTKIRTYAITFFTGGSLKSIYPLATKKQPVWMMSLAVSKRIGKVSELSLGTDFYYDKSLEKIQETDASLGTERPDVKAGAICFGHELLMGRISFLSQLAYYYYRPYDYNPKVYERIGLKLKLTKNIFIGAFLKAHYGSADFFEYVVGVKL